MTTERGVGTGGFLLPRIYSREQSQVIGALRQGGIDYADLTRWAFPDEFLCFVLQSKFFEFADESYPNPRTKNEVPIWFLICCQFLLRLHETGKYHRLDYLLNAGSVLSRVGFNVGSESIGFNDKNKYERKTAVNHDTVRKFFKDTDPIEIRSWYNQKVQPWFRTQSFKKVFDPKGIFILDQTHIVVPDNPNYAGAKRMPVDRYGQWYYGYDKLTDEQKKTLKHHPCYTLSVLLHLDTAKEKFHVAGYEFGPGNEDELTQARRLIPTFCQGNPGIMKELIVDRGYIDGSFAGDLKLKHGVDLLVPLKKNMSTYQDALGIASRENEWKLIEEQKDQSTGIMTQTIHASVIPEMDLWNNCPVKQHTVVLKQRSFDSNGSTTEENIWILGSTKKYSHPLDMLNRYRLRTQIEERYRQFKWGGWNITDFPSPDPGLMEAHICFTLLTYSLLQIYLHDKGLQEQTNRMIRSLKIEENIGGQAVLVYAGDSYAITNLNAYTGIVIDLDGKSKEKLKQLVKRQEAASKNKPD